jgi:hypothetical protein
MNFVIEMAANRASSNSTAVNIDANFEKFISYVVSSMIDTEGRLRTQSPPISHPIWGRVSTASLASKSVLIWNNDGDNETKNSALGHILSGLAADHLRIHRFAPFHYNPVLFERPRPPIQNSMSGFGGVLGEAQHFALQAHVLFLRLFHRI